jgi:hypothetical protein
MKIDNRQQLLGILAVAVVGLLLLDRVVITPLINGWKERSRQITELQKTIAQGESALKREKIVRDRWSQMKTNTLSADNAERKLLEAFHRWSRQSSISISSIQPQWKRGAAEEDYVTLECHANLAGSVGAMSQFLYNIERDPMALRIESLEITSRDENGRTLSLAMQVSALVLSAPTK